MQNNNLSKLIDKIAHSILAGLNFWSSKNLLTLIALGEGAALMYCSIVLDGHPIDDPLFWFAIPRGIMGIASSFATAYAGYELPRISKVGKGPIIQRLGFLSLALAIISTIVLISICTYGKPEGGWRAVASTAFSIIPAAGGLAVALASGRFFTEDTAPATATSSSDQNKQTGKKKKKGDAPAEQVVEQPVVTAAPVAEQVGSKMSQQVSCKWGCGLTASKGKINSHNKWCTHNPSSVNFKGVVVDGK